MQQPNPTETPRIRFPTNRIRRKIVRGTLFVILAAGLLYLSTLLFPNWRCMIADVQIAIAAPYQDCWKECTSWTDRPCSGYSSCYNKNIECTADGTIIPGGGSCQGCCFSCKVVCDNPTPAPQPPAISGSLSCSEWGAGGWCVGTESLDLTASDPQGKNVLISGDINGTPFACPSQASPAACSVPLPEGGGAANFLATSETGLTDSGSQDWQRDSVLPTVTGSLTGASGDNGWFISSVELSASVTETGSGLSAFETSLDGVDWTPYAAPLVFGNGTYTVRFHASDIAGNI
ncbi:MAG: hypothetical protein GXP40_07590, partial [Chloroflexi bacterium]|nr:hypothetical protein [Chloroflexota bacterium]